MTFRNLFNILGLLIIAAQPTSAQSQIDQDAIRKILYQHADDDSPGMAVGIVYKGEIVYEYYMGYANLNHKIKINKSTRFNIASCAKQYTALCVLKLVEDGKLSLKDDFRQYLPDYYKDIKDSIRIEHLLNHSSGIRDVYALWSLQGKNWWKLFIDNKDALKLLRDQQELNFKPGTQHLYSNSNYILLTELIKKASGQKFKDYSNSVFKELEMTNSHFLSNYSAVIPNKARAYRHWNYWREDPFITEMHGDGGLFTTLEDQLKWEVLLQQNNGSILSQKLINSSQEALANSDISNYGYGVELGLYKGENIAYHDGSTGAYHASFMRFPDARISIVAISNNANVPTQYMAFQIANEIMDLKTDKKTYPSGPNKLQRGIKASDITGSYREVNGDGTIMNIRLKNDSLIREIYQRNPRALVPEKSSLYHYADDELLKMAFVKEGKLVSGFKIYRPTNPVLSYERLPDFENNQVYQSSLNGNYINNETETQIVIKHLEGTKYNLIKNGRSREAILTYKDILRMNAYTIRVIRNPEHQIIGLKIDNDRILKVFFEKIED